MRSPVARLQSREHSRYRALARNAIIRKDRTAMNTRSLLRPLGAALAIAIGVATTGIAADAATLEAGTQINAVLASPDINTKNAQVGQQVELRIVAPFPEDEDALGNATVDAHVEQVQSGGQGRTAVLVLGVDRIRYANGTAAGIHARVTLTGEKADNTTARKALGAGVGAAVGSQTIGRILGGTLGSVVGIAGGAAAGYAYGKNNRPNENLAKNASVVLTLTRPLVITRRQAAQ
jgi:hypothetical protein